MATAEELLGLGDLTIRAERECEACVGTGRVEAEVWREARDRFRTISDPSARRSVEERFVERETGESAEEVPDEHDCHGCDGSGRTEVEITVGEIGRWVLDMVPTSILPRADLEDVIDLVKQRMTNAASRSDGIGQRYDDERDRAAASAEWLRVVREGAHALRELTDLLVERREA